jgi:hypothetical protein
MKLIINGHTYYSKWAVIDAIAIDASTLERGLYVLRPYVVDCSPSVQHRIGCWQANKETPASDVVV